MSSISATGSFSPATHIQPPSQPASQPAAGNDGDGDNDATESVTAKAQESSGGGLNVVA